MIETYQLWNFFIVLFMDKQNKCGNYSTNEPSGTCWWKFSGKCLKVLSKHDTVL
jgi:hypothetical protein